MSRTRKRVIATLIANFEGDYIPVDQAEDYLSSWIDGGLNDRDDLRGWELNVLGIVEEPLESGDAEDDAA